MGSLPFPFCGGLNGDGYGGYDDEDRGPGDYSYTPRVVPPDEKIGYDAIAPFSTKKALCIIKGNKIMWIPRSQIVCIYENDNLVRVPHWLSLKLEWVE